MTREDDIKLVCKAVIESGGLYWDNPNGPYEMKCPFCGGEIRYGGNRPDPSMAELPHEANCAYLVAKDLMTGIL